MLGEQQVTSAGYRKKLSQAFDETQEKWENKMHIDFRRAGTQSCSPRIPRFRRPLIHPVPTNNSPKTAQINREIGTEATTG